MKNIEKKIYHIILFLIIASIIHWLLSAMNIGDYNEDALGFYYALLGLISIILLYLPTLVEQWLKIKLSITLKSLFFVYVFLNVILGTTFGFLINVDGYDKLMHIFGDVLLVVVVFDVAHIKKVNHPLLVSIFAFMFSTTIHVFWEIYEFTVDTLSYALKINVNSNMQRYLWENHSTIFPQGYGLLDTMLDLILGCTFAFIAAVIGYFICKKKSY